MHRLGLCLHHCSIFILPLFALPFICLLSHINVPYPGLSFHSFRPPDDVLATEDEGMCNDQDFVGCFAEGGRSILSRCLHYLLFISVHFPSGLSHLPCSSSIYLSV